MDLAEYGKITKRAIRMCAKHQTIFHNNDYLCHEYLTHAYFPFSAMRITAFPNDWIHTLYIMRTAAAYILLLLFLSATAQTKRALVIGLGEQQDKAWNKIHGDQDVPLVQGMLQDAGFKTVTTLVNQQATKAGIVTALKQMAVSCKQGDVVYIHYSGHGQQMTDVHNDEKDGLDECWIPYDAYRKASTTYHGEKHLTDDELNAYLNAIRNKIGTTGKLLVVIDACHSGDGTRGSEDEVTRGVEDTLVVDSQHARGLYETLEQARALLTGGKGYTTGGKGSTMWDKGYHTGYQGKEKTVNPKATPLAERWITLSACASDQVNIEMKSPAVGKLTYALCQEMKKNGKGNNEEVMRRIRKFVNSNTSSRPQRPELTGEDTDKYNITDILKK